MGHYSFTRQLHNVSWIHGVDIILLLCPFYILDIFWIQLQLTFTVFLLKTLCSLWNFGKCLLINRRNIFPIFVVFVDTALLNGGLNQIIFRDLFFVFFRWFLMYLKSTLNSLFFRASLYPHFAVLHISLSDEFFDSLGWMEFVWCRLVGSLIIKNVKKAIVWVFVRTTISISWIKWNI